MRNVKRFCIITQNYILKQDYLEGNLLQETNSLTFALAMDKIEENIECMKTQNEMIKGLKS